MVRTSKVIFECYIESRVLDGVLASFGSTFVVAKSFFIQIGVSLVLEQLVVWTIYKTN